MGKHDQFRRPDPRATPTPSPQQAKPVEPPVAHAAQGPYKTDRFNTMGDPTALLEAKLNEWSAKGFLYEGWIPISPIESILIFKNVKA